MREHLTQTFHGKAQQKERLTWAGAEQQAEVSAGAGGPYLVFCKRSRDHGALRTRTGSAQSGSDPALTLPCGQPGRAPPPRSILGAGVRVGGALGSPWEARSGRHGLETGGQTGSPRQRCVLAWLDCCLPGVGVGEPETCLSLPPGLTRLLLSYFLHPSAPPFKYTAPHASLLKIFVSSRLKAAC